MIKHGYFIPFETTHTNIRLGNNRSAKNHPGFVSEAVSDLLEIGLITEMFSPPTVVNPLTVSFNSEDKGRLILDLRHVNKHVPKARFRKEDWRVFLQYIVPDGFMFKFDMKAGYYHEDIAYPHGICVASRLINRQIFLFQCSSFRFVLCPLSFYQIIPSTR